MVYTPLESYADRTYADAFVAAETPYNSTWSALSDDDKDQLLRTATRMIDALPLTGYKTVDTQEREFPRGDDVDIPDRVLRACCWIAVELARDNTMEGVREDSRRTSESTGEASVSFGPGASLADFVRGRLNSAEAFELMAPWMLDPAITRFARDS